VTDDFDSLFDQFQRTAFRLEAQPSYDVGGSEVAALAAWREGRPRPERSVRTQPWLARIATTTARGKAWRRLRVLDDPLTEYQHYQLTSGSYQESQACGDETLLVTRGQHEEWMRGIGDFWLFDHGESTERAVAMTYTASGEFMGFSEIADQELLQVVDHVARVAVEYAVPLAEYLAGMGVGVA
jgi:hypothetical protein